MSKSGRAGLRIAVIGGGIGGLSAAIALRQAGMDVDVYEKSLEFGEVGAGVSLQPNGLRVFDQLGFLDKIADAGVPLNDTLYRRWDGAVVDREGYTGVGIFRPDLIDILVAHLPTEILHTGHAAIGYHEEGNTAAVKFSNGDEVEADLVVAADGIHSTLQQYVTDVHEPVFSGKMAYRLVVPVNKAPQIPNGSAQDWLGGNKLVRIYHLQQGELVNVAVVVPAVMQFRESWTLPGDPARLQAEFDDSWDPVVRAIMGQVDNTVLCYALYDREPLRRWHTDRLVLLGDAAHPMLPWLGQGANSAIEDAMALATIIEGAPTTALTERLRLYQQLRQDRTARFQYGSRVHNRRRDMDNPFMSHVPLLLDRPGTHDYDVRAAAQAVRHQRRPHNTHHYAFSNPNSEAAKEYSRDA
jgi:2-polyprenyl-6-methoxyphenol hydroxylase-like FAD-dependent oxidoreductase